MVSEELDMVIVGGCLILDDELIVVGQGISHPDGQFS